MLFTRITILILTAIVAIACGAEAITEPDTGGGTPSGTAGASALPASRVDKSPCDLLTRTELEGILKAQLADGRHERATCTYDAAGQPARAIEIEVDWTDGRETMDAWRAGTGMVDAMLKRDMGQSVVSSDDLAGLGDEAMFTMAGFQPFLNVRKGDAAFTLKAMGASRDETIAIARIAAGRLP